MLFFFCPKKKEKSTKNITVYFSAKTKLTKPKTIGFRGIYL